MVTYRAVVEYDGTDRCGFQFQGEVPTVAGALEAALSSLFQEAIAVTSAGRTDAGVHATGQVISFRSQRNFPPERLALALNAHLPHDISVREAAIVNDRFSARFDATRRIYEYVILNRAMPSAVARRWAHHVWNRVDLALARRNARDFLGEHDFVAFCGVLPDRGGTVRTVHAIEIERSGDIIVIRIEGRGFLHRMVRISVGTLLEIATGRRADGDIPRIIASRDRKAAGYTAPASGLYLAGVAYADGFTSHRPVAIPPAGGAL